jgi:putative flippase GtrA
MVTGLRASMTRIGEHSGVRFLVVGGLSVAVDVGSLYVLHGVLQVWLPVATATAYLVSFGVNFTLNRIWTFGSTGTPHGQLLRYGGLFTMNLGLTVVLVQFLSTLGMPYLLSKVCTTAVLSTMNYFVSRRWIFT